MKKPLIHPEFLLDTETAQELFHNHAENLPILDYHCHLPPADIASDRTFANLTEVWLEGDHYKWRAMRANGEPEVFCTGNADPFDKFLAYARTVPATLRNPLFHWTHLELSRYFGIDVLLNPSTAPEVWDEANRQLSSPTRSACGILKAFKVELVGTTDDPNDLLPHHHTLKAGAHPFRVAPTFRPDKALLIDQTANWNAWIDQLASVSGVSTGSYSDLLSALEQRLEAFADLGCMASDHGLEACPTLSASQSEAAEIFSLARQGNPVSPAQAEAFRGHLLTWLGEAYHARGWVMQLHLGATRNVNAGLFNQLGPDVGCDSISDQLQIAGLRHLLGSLSASNRLPRTVLYNLNPAQNYAFATMCGNFFEAGIPGKMQFGSGWWFLDQLEGMEWQLNALSNLGLLNNFIGMLTDSRSFLSFPRHEYFRRLLCRIIGHDVAAGLLPDDLDLLGSLVRKVSYENARNYFRLGT
ncbi:MAG: glucuronate isomerase [Puniceicoccaceae bacterium]